MDKNYFNSHPLKLVVDIFPISALNKNTMFGSNYGNIHRSAKIRSTKSFYVNQMLNKCHTVYPPLKTLDYGGWWLSGRISEAESRGPRFKPQLHRFVHFS